MMNRADLTLALRNFTGTETWFRHPFFQFLYTEGVEFLAEQGGCYWLMEMIFGFQKIETVRAEYFQTWDLTVNENKTAILQCGDGTGNIVFTHTLNYTDFPLSKIRLYFTDNVLLLPSEW